MDKIISSTKAAIAVIGSFLAAALGGADALIFLLICLTFVDITLGGLKGAKKKNFSSSILFWGLINKAVIFVVVALMYRVDIAIGLNSLFRNSFIIWFSLCEGASIIENSATLGIPWPDG
jgi:toxin secretion/phage lysis holin